MELQLFDENKFNQAVKLSSTLAKSTVVPMHFRNKPEEIFACLVLGAELGFNPMQSLNSVVFIQGTATLKASTMLALARAKVKDLSVEIVEGKDEVVVTIKRGSDSYTSTWNDTKAAAMGLLGKDNYKKQKITMYRWRGVSEALKIMCPDILMGLNMAEELEDLPPIKNDPLIDLQQAAREDVERMRLEQQKPEDVQVGPLYLIENGSHRGTRLYELSIAEIEDYLNKLNTRTTKRKDWENELINVFTEYLSRVDEFREMILELQGEE